MGLSWGSDWHLLGAGTGTCSRLGLALARGSGCLDVLLRVPRPCKHGLLLDLRKTPRQPDPHVALFARLLKDAQIPECPNAESRARSHTVRSSRAGAYAKVRSRRRPKAGGHERRRVPQPCCEHSNALRTTQKDSASLHSISAETDGATLCSLQLLILRYDLCAQQQQSRDDFHAEQCHHGGGQ